MAESNDSLLQFDSIVVDVNENLSNSENGFLNDTDTFKTAAPNSYFQKDVAQSETQNFPETFHSFSQIAEIPKNGTELPSNCSEMSFEILDLTSNQDSDSGIHDSDNNIIQNSKLIDFANSHKSFVDNCGVIISDFGAEQNVNDDVQFKEEEFHDAVQFFKDPSSLAILENAGASSAPTDPLISRSSLYMNFDPLHAKFYSESCATVNDLHEITEDETEPEMVVDDPQSDIVPDVVNKHLSNVSPRHSLGNVLISFDSPVVNKVSDPLPVEDKIYKPVKMYTEEELQQALKIQELTVQETFLKRQHDLEITRSQQQQTLEAELEKFKCLSNALHCTLIETIDVAVTLSEKEKKLQEKLDISEKENNKLKDDLKTSVEDFQSVESTFSDFHKRYEQSKSMLKVFTQNEDQFRLQISNLKTQLNEKEEMYKALQARTQEMVDKANTEVINAKKGGEAQVAVLKAQLKKAELKISNLESDVKRKEIEIGKLSTICDELMVKVSEA